MKNYTLLIIASVFSLNGFTQQNNYTTSNKKTEKTLILSNNLSNDKLAVGSYRVEETINMNFGGRKTTYTVSNIGLVDTYELGPENTRVVTPKFTITKSKEMTPVVKKLIEISPVNMTNVIEPVSIDFVIIPKRKLGYITINIVENYERVLQKGYISEEMLEAVANYRFFIGDLDISAKWYSKLFDICPEELDAVYYYRFAKSLFYINQIEKAKAMMAKFESLK